MATGRFQWAPRGDVAVARAIGRPRSMQDEPRPPDQQGQIDPLRRDAVIAYLRDATGPQGSRAWLGFVLWQAALFADYLLQPARIWLWPAIAVSAVVATVAGVSSHRPARLLPWYLLAASELCFAAGDTSYRVLTHWYGEHNPYPSVADLCYLMTYPLFTGGLFLLIRGRAVRRDTAALLDALIVTTGLALLSWVFLVQPQVHADNLTAVQRAVSIAYPLGDVLVLAMLAHLMTAGGLHCAATRLLMCGALGLLVSDICYGWIQLHGTWRTGTPIDLGWAVYYTAWGAAALHPSMRHIDHVARRSFDRPGAGRIAALAGASLIAPSVLLAQSLTGRVLDGVTIAVFAAISFALVIGRLAGIMAIHRQSLSRERVLRSCAEALVSAQSIATVCRALLDGVAVLRGGRGEQEVSLFLAHADVDGDGDGEEIRCVASNRLAVGAAGDLVYWIVARRGGELDGTGRVSVTPLFRDQRVNGMLVVCSRAPISWEEHGALRTLAAQAALAIEAIGLAADLRQRESEAHFRALVQNASDIILVVDAAGTVIYAAPSLERALDRPVAAVLGGSLFDLVGEADLSQARATLATVAARQGLQMAAGDWRLRAADGRLLAFETLANDLRHDTTVGGIVLTMRAVSQRRALEDQLAHQAFHDALTALPNRLLFEDRAELALERSMRLGCPFIIGLIDVDDLNEVNDSRGGFFGDEVLRTVARRLDSVLPGHSTLARFAGGKFAFAVEDVADREEALAIAGDLLGCFAAPFQVQGELFPASASVGLVLSDSTESEPNVSGLLRCAELALLDGKARGRGQLVLYDVELHVRTLERVSLRSQLQRAVESNEFAVVYQPIMLIESGRIVGAETLLRWQHPSRGELLPAQFIDLAERSGLIVPLGAWVLDEACRQARGWLGLCPEFLGVSVNLSRRQLQELAFVDHVRAVLARHEVAPRALMLELAESVLVDEEGRATERLTALDQLGVRIVVDDFGTGYSSLAYLSRFPIAMLKIDKSCVERLGADDPGGDILARAIVSVAHSLRLDVLAEGVDRAAQRDALWALGCRLAQGHLYSAAVTAEEFSSMIASDASLGPPLLGTAR